MELKIRDYYMNNVLNKYHEMFNANIERNEADGMYYLHKIGLCIKSWNLKVEIMMNSMDLQEQVMNLIKFINESEHYWFEIIEESREEHEQDEKVI